MILYNLAFDFSLTSMYLILQRSGLLIKNYYLILQKLLFC